jgi:alpha-tubulin suppressor-like RCC1 family protein
MGSGKKGQLGHGGFGSEDSPRIVKYFEQNKISSVTQVSAAFHSSIVLTSNHKVYWFGTNNTIKMVCTPELLPIKDKVIFFLCSHNTLEQTIFVPSGFYLHGVVL